MLILGLTRLDVVCAAALKKLSLSGKEGLYRGTGSESRKAENGSGAGKNTELARVNPHTKRMFGVGVKVLLRKS